MRTAGSRAVVGLGMILAIGWPTGARAQTFVRGPLLNVPFVAQSEDLCGGAALAMVRRYWGDAAALADDMAALVDPSRHGIPTGRLTSAAAEGPWMARALADADAPAATVRSRLEAGQPVIALIDARPGARHYVVIVAWTDTEVVFHDPARAPFRRMPVDAFLRRWAGSHDWMLVVTPDDPVATRRIASDLPAPEPAPATSACRGHIETAVAEARRGETATAERDLIAATVQCPDEAVAWRELGGVRLMRRDWPAAEDAARGSLARDPTDTASWRLLAVTRYMQHDSAAALRAWNHAGGPSLDTINVTSSGATPAPVIISALGLRPGHVLRAPAFQRAARRLAELPIAEQSALRLEPPVADRATISAVVAEHRSLPSWPVGWIARATHALAARTVAGTVVGPMASADAWHGQWRWTPHRPAASVRLTTPLPGGRPGLVSLGAAWERQAYRQSPTTTSHERRRADVSLSDWASGMLRWQLGLALDRFDTRRTLAASAGIDRRWHDDRIALLLSAEGWTAGFANGRSLVAVRTAAEDVPRWSARAGLAAASRTAPLALWPRAGIDRAFVATARAHPARTDDIMQADSLGRQLAFASVEYAPPIVAVPGRQVSLASFLDAVVIAGHQTARRPLTHLDVGVGLRVPVPEVGGVLGLDVAWGTQDGRVRLSAAVRRAWPGR